MLSTGIIRKKSHKGYSRKLKVELSIDDRNLGGVPDWGTIYRMISEKLTYEDLHQDHESYGHCPRPSSAKEGILEQP